ncbi:MAG: hypothetical protein RLZZ519_2857 [Bacteroidota bacterium]
MVLGRKWKAMYGGFRFWEWRISFYWKAEKKTNCDSKFPEIYIRNPFPNFQKTICGIKTQWRMYPTENHPRMQGTPNGFTIPVNATFQAPKRTFHFSLITFHLRGIRSKVLSNNPQNFCTELIWTLSSGLWAPVMLGPKEIISIAG